MIINLNGEKANCFVEKVYSLSGSDLQNVLSFSNHGISEGCDRSIVYQDNAGVQHCVLAFSDMPYVRVADIALIHASEKEGSAEVIRLEAADFSVDSGMIELDHLIIKLRATTEFLLDRRRRIPKGADCTARYSEINCLFSIDLSANKDLAIMIGEILYRQNAKIFTELEADSISVQIAEGN
jgi:hypothetical protein